MRGMLAGAIAGLFAFGVARSLGEPQVNQAIAFEEAHSDGGHHSHADADEHSHADMANMGANTSATMAGMADEAEEPELVSRTTQAGIGLLVASVVYGVGIGGLFSLVFAAVYGRVGHFGPRSMAALLGLAAFISVTLIPAMTFPPNPPAVGSHDTIGYRTAAYFLMLVLSVGAMAFAVSLAQHMMERFGAWNGALMGVVAFGVIVFIGQLMMPGINEVPDDFPAVLLWKFRTVSIGIQFVMWAGVALLFGVLAERALSPAKRIAGSH